MVAVAAFLIICVILFGLENVRGFFFGTLGVVGWVIFGILALGALVLFGEWLEKERQEEKKARTAQKEADKALIENMKKNDPKTYKSIVRMRKFALISLIVFLVIFASLLAIVFIAR